MDNDSFVVMDRLSEEFPDLFIKKGWCNVHPGWEHLIRALCLEIETINKGILKDNPRHTKKNLITFGQIKEKFGALRVYCDYEDLSSLRYAQLTSIISLTERLSEVTCYVCGNKGVTIEKRGYWIMGAVCKEHVPEPSS